MSIASLRAALRKRPFRAFVITTTTGRRVEVRRSDQVSLSPDSSLIVVAIGDASPDGGPRVEVVPARELASIEPAKPAPRTKPAPAKGAKGKPTKAPPSAKRAPSPGQPAQPAPRPTVIATGVGGASLVGTRRGQVVRPAPCGQIVLFPHESEGVPVCTAIAQDAAGRPMIDLSGTQYDVHGVESGDNYLTLHMTHTCQPGALIRLLIWPPDSASLETFSESRPVGEIQRVLRGADEQLRSKPRPPQPPRAYFDHLRVPPARHSPRPLSAPAHGEQESERFEAEELVAELRQGEPSPQARLVDTIEGEALLDLVGSDLASHLTRTHDDGRAWRLRVWWPGSEPGAIDLDIDPYARAVRVPGSAQPVPLAFVERTLRSASCLRARGLLQTVLANGPQPHSAPVVGFQHRDGATVELWPGFAREGRSLLAPLVRDVRGAVILDMRGTSWGGGVDVSNEHALLWMVSASGVASQSELDRPVAVNLRTRRVRLEGSAGATTAGVLQHLINEFGAPSVFVERLEEAMAQGAELPSVP